MSDFQTGLVISGIGLLVTFSSLLMFIGIMVLLKKLFPAKKRVDEEKPCEEANKVEVSIETDDRIDEITAALVAVAFMRAQRTGQLGASLLSGPGPYRTSR